jgi:voltage-gated potassium channel
MTNFKFLNEVIDWFITMAGELIRQKVVIYGLSVAIGATLLFGFAISMLDPNVHSLWDGIWYAWVTLTHVGYGDIVPTSLAGRLLASVLILLGLGVLALLTATFSAILISRNVNVVEREESQILAEIARLHQRLDKLEASLKPPSSRSRRSTES